MRKTQIHGIKLYVNLNVWNLSAGKIQSVEKSCDLIHNCPKYDVLNTQKLLVMNRNKQKLKINSRNGFTLGTVVYLYFDDIPLPKLRTQTIKN